MMINVVYADLPPKVKAFTVCQDGYYTIVLNQNLSKAQNQISYLHELDHIIKDDFNKEDIQKIEHEAHGGD